MFVTIALCVTGSLGKLLFGEWISIDGLINIGVSDEGVFSTNGDDPPQKCGGSGLLHEYVHENKLFVSVLSYHDQITAL